MCFCAQTPRMPDHNIESPSSNELDKARRHAQAALAADVRHLELNNDKFAGKTGFGLPQVKRIIFIELAAAMLLLTLAAALLAGDICGLPATVALAGFGTYRLLLALKHVLFARRLARAVARNREIARRLERHRRELEPDDAPAATARFDDGDRI